MHDPSNLVLLCGSGTTGCHGWVHAHPSEAHEQGLYLVAGEMPWQTPMLTVNGWVQPDRDGGFSTLWQSVRRALV